jgi:hypothetical protein
VAAECRGCGARIMWAALAGFAKPQPINIEPVEGGNVVLERDEGHLQGRLVARDAGVIRHTSHFDTCPQAQRFRDMAKRNPDQGSLL